MMSTMFNEHGLLRDLKLGRRAIKTDSRTLRLAKYFTPGLPAPPSYRNWSKGIQQWGMMLNDNLGDCTIAAVGHAVQGLTANASKEVTVPDSVVLGAYEKWCGYNPADPNSDQGGICLDVLNDWRQQGFGGHKLLAYASVLPANQSHIKQAINLFGGTYIGVGLPISAQNQVGGLWDVVPQNAAGDSTAGSWGGHCVWVLAYNAVSLICVTWGQLQRMTWRFWNAYVDESYVPISPDWIAASGKAPNGFNLAALQSDLVQVT
jgi:hypothetical protein